jgi:hypothetical protein
MSTTLEVQKTNKQTKSSIKRKDNSWKIVKMAETRRVISAVSN